MSKETQPFITIGIASYNYAHYLLEAFEAIKRQSFKDYEVLYADDGSTDDSVSVIERLIAENPNMDIRLVRGENIGVMGNKQRLIDHARGKYLMLCDADDWMDDDCLETIAHEAMQTGADRIVTEFKNIDGNTGRLLFVQTFPKKPSKWCEVLHHGAAYRRSAIIENGIAMPETPPDDLQFVTVFNIFASSTAFIRKSVYNWRLHSGSLSNHNWESNAWRGYSLLHNMFAFLSDMKEEYGYCLSQADIDDIQALLVKHYYYYLIKDVSAIRPAKRMYSEYSKMRRLMKANIPNYETSMIRRKFKDSPFRIKAYCAIWLMGLLECIHLLYPSLLVYGFLTGAGRRCQSSGPAQ